MTDARFPDRWLLDRRFRRLTAEEFRTFAVSLMWSVANRTDGELPGEDLEFVPDVSVDHAGRLVELGLWAPIPSGWVIVDFADTQTSREQLEGLDDVRRQNASRQRKKRALDKARHVTPSRDDMGEESRDGHATKSRDDIGKARQGKDRQGQERSSIRESSETEPVEILEGPGSVPAVCARGCGSVVPAGVEVCDWCAPAGSAGEITGGCSVPGCAGVVTDYLRREYGEVCIAHAGSGVTA